MNNLIKLIILLLISLTAQAQVSDPGTPEAYSVVEENIRDLTIPCHKLNLRYYDGYPASTTLTDDQSNASIKNGKVTSDKYKKAAFKALNQYKNGETKIYYKKYHEFNFDDVDEATFNGDVDSKFIGHVRIDARVVHEVFDLEKHGKWTRDDYNSVSRRPGNARVLPYLFSIVQVNPAKKSWEFWKASLTTQVIAYEVCRIRWFIDARYNEADFNVAKSEYSTFPYEWEDGLMYQEDDTPTFWGYRWEQRNNRSDISPEGELARIFLIAGQAVPILGTTISLAECLEKSDALCWASFGLDAASDVLFFAKWFKAANIASKVGLASGSGQDLCKINRYLELAEARNIDLYAIGAGNLTLGGLYAMRGEYIAGLGRAAAGLGDLVTGVLLTPRGFVGGKIGLLSDANKACKEDEVIELTVDLLTNPALDAGDLKKITEIVQQRYPDVPNAAERAKELVTRVYKRALLARISSAVNDPAMPSAVAGVRSVGDVNIYTGTSGWKEGGYLNFWNNLHPDLKERIIQNSVLNAEQIKVLHKSMDEKYAELTAKGVVCPNTNGDFNMYNMLADVPVGDKGKTASKQVSILVDGETILVSKESWSVINCAEVEAMDKWLKADLTRTLQDPKMMYTMNAQMKYKPDKYGSPTNIVMTKEFTPKARCANCTDNFPEDETLIISDGVCP